MITVHIVGKSGVSMYIENFLQLLLDYREHLVNLWEISDYEANDVAFAYIAIFKEPNSIGQYTAFVSDFSISRAPYYEYHVGPFFEKHELEPTEPVISFDEFLVDNNIKLDNLNLQRRFSVWQTFVELNFNLGLPDILPISEETEFVMPLYG